MGKKKEEIDLVAYWYTWDEIAEELGVTYTTLKTAFPRTQQHCFNRGLILKKFGRGDDALFTLEERKDNG